MFKWAREIFSKDRKEQEREEEEYTIVKDSFLHFKESCKNLSLKEQEKALPDRKVFYFPSIGQAADIKDYISRELELYLKAKPPVKQIVDNVETTDHWRVEIREGEYLYSERVRARDIYNDVSFDIDAYTPSETFSDAEGTFSDQEAELLYYVFMKAHQKEKKRIRQEERDRLMEIYK